MPQQHKTSFSDDSMKAVYQHSPDARGMSLRNPFAMIPAGEESVALASLPLTVLNLSKEHAQTFSLWGIHTLGMLAELPETELIARMGQEGKRLQLLSRGTLLQLFVPLEPALALEERMELDSPVEQDATDLGTDLGIDGAGLFVRGGLSGDEGWRLWSDVVARREAGMVQKHRWRTYLCT
jgi:hypothetical protein